MVTNERQYRITKSWLERFKRAREGVEQDGETLQPRARQALRDQYESQIEELRAQLVSRRTRVGTVALHPARTRILDAIPIEAPGHPRVSRFT